MAYLLSDIVAKYLHRGAVLCTRNKKFSKTKFSWNTSQSGHLCFGSLAVRNYVTGRHVLNFIIRRSYASQSSRKAIPKKFRKEKLPFESKSIAHQDILLFTHHKKEFQHFLISMFGIFLFATVLNSSELIYRTLNNIKQQPGDEKRSWYQWWKAIDFQSKWVKYGAPGFLVLFAFAALGFSLAYPTVMVREVTLLKGGEKILLQTYRPFGLTKTFELNVKDVSAQWGPTEAKYYLPLRPRGKRTPFLLNSDGVYHNQQLFDQTVGLHRF